MLIADAMPLSSSQLDALAAETAFAGVVRVDRAGEIELARAYGLAHRGFEIPNEVDTRFGIASGAKAFTALAVVSLIEEGVLQLSTTARSVLGSDLPLIDAHAHITFYNLPLAEAATADPNYLQIRQAIGAKSMLMNGFTSIGPPQRFLSAFRSISPQNGPVRHRLTALQRLTAMAAWPRLAAARTR